MLRPAVVVLVLLTWTAQLAAQDLEPRRWTHLPDGSNVVGLTYAYSTGKLLLDPVLEVTEGTSEINTLVAAYVRSFAMLGTTARIDALLPFANAHWSGLVSGEPQSRSQTGLADPWLRFSINLLGSPPLKGKDYLEYRASKRVHTVFGVGLGVKFPLGVYDSNKLFNIGENRFAFRPQAGVVHYRGRWSFELTGSVFLYTPNDDFYSGNRRTQDPIFAAQAHVVHTFENRWWLGAGFGYHEGGENQVNGVSQDDRRSGTLGALSLGFPITRSQAIKATYMRGDALGRIGADANTLFFSWNLRF